MTKNTKGTPRPATGKQNNTILRPKRWYWETILVPPSVKKVYLSPTQNAAHAKKYGPIEDAVCQFLGGPVRRELLDLFIGMLETAEASFGPGLYAPEEDLEKGGAQ